MKPVFRCDYCSKMGTEEEIREHEPICTDNYDRKSCHTCANRKFAMKDGKYNYECEADIDIPEGKMYEFCNLYKRRVRTGNITHDLFGGLLF